MTQITSTADLIAMRYNTQFAIQIEAMLKQPAQSQIDLFDIMAINEAVYALGQEIKAAITAYRGLSDKGEIVVPFHMYHQAAMQGRHIGYLWKTYRAAKADSRKLTDEYQRRLKYISFFPIQLVAA